MSEFLLCSNCFRDQGLKLDDEQFGAVDDSVCPNCSTTTGRKLTQENIEALAHRFFVLGTLHRCDYGAAPIVQFNKHQTTCIKASPWFEPDLRLIEKAIGVGFFYYGPRMWMVGEVEPLKALQEAATEASIVDRIIKEYPTISIGSDNLFYRIRKAPGNPAQFSEYDRLHWQVARLCALEDAVDVASRTPKLVDKIRPIRNQSAGGNITAFLVDRGQLVLGSTSDDQITMDRRQCARRRDQTTIRRLRDVCF